MKNKLCLLSSVLFILCGCSWLAPKYERPALDMPQKWFSSANTEQRIKEALQDWWKEYHDPVLEKLINGALSNNDDLSLAGARLQQAQAQYDYAFGNQFPLLTTTGIASRWQFNFKNNTLLTNNPGSFSFIGGMLSYEVDLWGKLASASQAAKAAFLAATYNQNAVRLSVATATAQLYFNILALDADIKITQDTIQSREEAYMLVKKQYDHEAVSGLVLRQSEAEWDGTRAQLPKLMEQKDKAESSLSVLLGRPPQEMIEGRIERGVDIDALPVPPVVPAALPSSLLERRPDIASAEQALIASNFNIGVARAAYFPTISLSNLLGVSNVDIKNLYQGTVRTWLMGASLAGPVIDFGRTESSVDLALAKNQEQIVSYKNAVRSAFKEVKDALSEQIHTRDEEEAQTHKEKAIKEALRLANLRYSSGYSSYIEVLDAERNLYESQISLIASKLNRLNASVNVYKALGGGWNLSSVQ